MSGLQEATSAPGEGRQAIVLAQQASAVAAFAEAVAAGGLGRPVDPAAATSGLAALGAVAGAPHAGNAAVMGGGLDAVLPAGVGGAADWQATVTGGGEVGGSWLALTESATGRQVHVYLDAVGSAYFGAVLEPDFEVSGSLATFDVRDGALRVQGQPVCAVGGAEAVAWTSAPTFGGGGAASGVPAVALGAVAGLVAGVVRAATLSAGAGTPAPLPPAPVCVACADPMRPGDRFCPHCGARQPIRCDRCGARADAGARFCGGCGAGLSV